MCREWGFTGGCPGAEAFRRTLESVRYDFAMPCTAAASCSSFSISPPVSLIETAATFSANLVRLCVPGIGIIFVFRRWAGHRAVEGRVALRSRPSPPH